MSENNGLSSFDLRVIAMMAMLLDHIGYGTAVSIWLRVAGRVAFPIFAFLAVEGVLHTQNIKEYGKRLLIFAIVSEVPYNLMISRRIANLEANNVIWILLAGVMSVHALNIFQKSDINMFLRGIGCGAVVILAIWICKFSLADYGSCGMMSILSFYFFRGNKLWQRVGQLSAMIYINIVLMGEVRFYISFAGYVMNIPIQSFALLALPIVWMYNGREGIKSEKVKRRYYWFYPAHMIVIYFAGLIFER